MPGKNLNFKKIGNPLVLSTKSYENGDKSEFKDTIWRAKLQNHYVGNSFVNRGRRNHLFLPNEIGIRMPLPTRLEVHTDCTEVCRQVG